MKIRRCTLYDRKHQTNSYDSLRIKRVHALESSVSFKPIFILFDSVLYVLALLAIHNGHRRVCVFIILHTVQTL